MYNLVVLTYMYPNEGCVYSGNFIHQTNISLQNMKCKIKVIYPVPYVPYFMKKNKKYRKYLSIPFKSKKDGIDIFYPRYIRFPGKVFYITSILSMFLSVMLNYKKITKGSRPQIIHAHTATPSGFIAMLLKVIFRIPVVISLRGSDINIYPNQSKSIKLLTKYVIRRADAVTAVSKQLARKAIELGVFNKKISVVYNGCNVDIFKYNMERRNKIRSEYKLLFNDIILLFIGNLTKGKGIYNLIEIFKKISKTNKNIYLFIIGEGEEKNNLIKIIKQHQINEKVILLNGCSHESVADWMSASDIFVMLSKKEGLPNVILEAMACERPVVAGKVGGIPEIIEEEKYGTLVNLDDPITIEKKIEELIWKPEKRARMGRESRERIKTNFSWSETANKMMEIYRKINH